MLLKCSRFKCTLLSLFVAFLLWYAFALPKPLFDKPLSTVLEDRRGQLLDARVAGDEQWRFPMPDSLPSKYVLALTQFEDKRFFRHRGVDLRALARALRQNIRAKKIVSGGSTISMQLIRMARAPKPRNLWQKLLESILATRLELAYDKDYILRLYATYAPFGGNVVGLEAACWRYFGKRPEQISWAEAALLAVLPNSPGLLHLSRGRQHLLSKRNRLLDRLLERSFLDSLEWDLAKAEPLPDQPHALPHLAPHLLDKLIAEGFEGQRLRTTLDATLQLQALNRMDYRLAALKGNGIHNMAALIVKVTTGEVLVYVGNMPDAGQENQVHVNVIPAPRSTGSILKPLLYASALDAGLISPHSLLPDYPTSINGYRPDNYYSRYEGAVRAERALVRSLNIPMVHLLRKYSVERFSHRLQAMGLSHITRPASDYGLTLILGGAEASLWDLCQVYSGMASRLRFFADRQGMYSLRDGHTLHVLSSDSLPFGKWNANPDFLSASSIWWTFEAMRQLERPNQWGEWQQFSSARPIAWKTGTSFGFRDAWAIGLTPEYLVGVWVGNADGEGRPGLIGVHAAGPVLFDLFELLPATGWFEPPIDELSRVVICQNSGYAALPSCPKDTLLLPTAATEKLPPCSYHRKIYLDTTGKYRVYAACANDGKMQEAIWFVLSPAEEYYYKQIHPDYRPLPPYAPYCEHTEEYLPMQLLYPANKTEIIVPKELDGSKGKVVFKAIHTLENTRIYWFLGDNYLGETQILHNMAVAPPPGHYLLTLVDDEGYRLQREIVIASNED